MVADLERRLDRIGRRQRYTLLLLIYPYLVGILWAVSGRIDPTGMLLAVVPGLGVVVAAYLVALYRARAGDGG